MQNDLKEDGEGSFLPNIYIPILMKIISWIVRGLKSKEMIRDVEQVISANQVEIVGLVVTKVGKKNFVVSC